MGVLVREPCEFSLLIADDEESSREVLRDIVEPEGYETVLAESGEEALDIVQRRPIHLMLCDMYMPQMTGLETLEVLRQSHHDLPCILISGEVSDRLRRQALTVRIYSVLAKPVSGHSLRYTIDRALAHAYEA